MSNLTTAYHKSQVIPANAGMTSGEAGSAALQPLTRLSDAQREQAMAALAQDGFVVLPGLLPEPLRLGALDAIDRLAAQTRASDPAKRKSVKLANIVDRDPVFRALLTHEPAVQLAYDCFGPMFHLCQSNLVSRPRDAITGDSIGSSAWHADGPRPRGFPQVAGAVGLHYLKYGYFLTDLTHGTGSSLQVVRGSHLRPELDRKGADFDIADYASELVQLDCPAGTVVAFNQALWHAAAPNQSEIERKNCYVSYCPTWMRPLDRDLPAAGSLTDASAEERWLLGESLPTFVAGRIASRWWLPGGDDMARMNRFARDAERHRAIQVADYD